MFFSVHLIIYTAKRVADNNRTMLMQSSFAFRGEYGEKFFRAVKRFITLEKVWGSENRTVSSLVM